MSVPSEPFIVIDPRPDLELQCKRKNYAKYLGVKFALPLSTVSVRIVVYSLRRWNPVQIENCNANAIPLRKGHICTRFCCGSIARNSGRQSSRIKWSWLNR